MISANLSAEAHKFPKRPKDKNNNSIRCSLGSSIRLWANHYVFQLNKAFQIFQYDVTILKVFKDGSGKEVKKEVKTRDASK